ncbi:hypothetical protein H7K45_21955 [Mycobacterium yunnanensis]|uniref:Uncharacterized protein n=1 Tax=Mycobacterium yunnanensis TaxID=368477 RepID=A0A9X2YPT6_9MYCO|nr:hypothetical protein [Mycobacterium yunnanensis]MCV7423223.1 hypothetical protein [Mycobacterium yunnanensis]
MRLTASALLGGAGGLFSDAAPLHSASLHIDESADVPRGTRFLTPGRRFDVDVRMSDGQGHSSARTVCIKIPDIYGVGRDQDFLMASSADGVPIHHAVLPVERPDTQLYSSLWLYLAGLQPVVFGLRANHVTHDEGLAQGDRFDFLVCGAVSRFRRIGELTIDGQPRQSALRFTARNAGGGIRALPPALFYRG